MLPAIFYPSSIIKRVAGLTLIYALLARMVLTFTIDNGDITMLWLPGGVGLAALLIGGKQLWPGVFLGAASAGIMMHDPLWVALLIALGNTLESLCAAYLLSRIKGFETALQKPGDFIYLTTTALLSCLISALIGPLTLFAAGFLPAQTLLTSCLNWWQADCIGILLCTPLILIWQHKPQGWLQGWRIIETVSLFACAFLAGQILFLDWFHTLLGQFSMSYWLYLLVTWAALRYGQHGVALIVTMTAVQAFEGARRGKGYFAHDMLTTGLENYWFYFLTLTTVGLFLALNLETRKKTEQDLREKTHALSESESRFRNLSTIAPVAIFCSDANGKLIFVNDAWLILTELSTESALGSGWDARIHAEDQQRVFQEWNQAFRSFKMFSSEFRIPTETEQIKSVLARAIAHYDEAEVLVGYIGTLTDITERKANEKAMEEAAQSKDEFLAMLAHELRNPLAPIGNAVQILKRSADNPARIAWCSDIIKRQLDHMTRLVDDLLDVSRISRGVIELRKEILELRDFIKPALEVAQPLLNKRKQNLTITLPPEPLWIEGDRVRLAQVLSNLISNAAKFTEEEGQIELTAKASNDCVCIQVTDNGCGIIPSELSRLFELFYQGNRNLDRTQGGLGIGLSLVNTLVKKHGGEVHAFSAGLGQGSQFEIRLPLINEDLPKSTYMNKIFPQKQKKLCILVVDDNPDVAESLALLLKTEAHQVLIANDSATALEIAHAKQPDVMVLDIGLPDMNGYELAQVLRSSPKFERTLLIAATGYGQANDIKKSYAAGFDNHLVKPIDFDILQKLLADYEKLT